MGNLAQDTHTSYISAKQVALSEFSGKMDSGMDLMHLTWRLAGNKCSITVTQPQHRMKQ
jgi:hypothetical protein